MSRPVVVCALRYERQVLARQGLGRFARLECCGVGAASVRAWARRCGAGPDVLLAGLAGGLRSGFPARSAWVACAVVDEAGRRRVPSWPAPPDLAGAVIAEAAAPLTTPAAKHAYAERRGADLVDLESGAFAAEAEARGWRWTVVRGVGDDSAAALPPDVARWVDARGRLRPGRAILSLARRPAWIGSVLRMQADGVAALRSAAEILQRLLEGAGSPSVP